MKRVKGIVKGAMTYLKRPYVLKYVEEQPTVYKIQLVRGNVIKEDAIIAYAANAASVPESTVVMAKNALFDAINYFCANGRRVMVPNLGSFAPVTRAKFTRTAEDCTVDTIKKHGRVLRFYPKSEIAASGSASNITLTENKSLSNMACGAMLAEINGQFFLVNSEGKFLVVQVNNAGSYQRIQKTGNTYSLVPSQTKPLKNEVAVVGSLTSASAGSFKYGNTEYTLGEGSLTPEPNNYGVIS